MPGGTGLLGVPRLAENAGSVIACALTSPQRARLTDALGSRSALTHIDAPSGLLPRLRSTIDGVDAIVLPSSHPSDSIERIVREVSSQWPRVALLIYCDFADRHSAEIRRLTAAGVHEFILAGINDHGIVLRSVLEQARRGCAAEWVESQLEELVPSVLHRVIESILAHADRVTSIPDLARELGVHRKTLFNWCERADFLPPGELLAWTRLALVAYYLESTGCTIETIANDLGYPSDTALRNTIKRYTLLRATDIRRNGGVRLVIDAFRARLAGESAQLHQV